MEISHPASDAMHEVSARACSTAIDSALRKQELAPLTCQLRNILLLLLA